MFKSNINLKGRVKIALNGKTVRDIDNLVVNSGKNYVASRMKDTTETPVSHMAVGTGSTAPAAGDTALGAEAARVTLTSTTRTDNELTYVATFAAGTGTAALTEAGLFNASSGGTLLARTVFAVVNKGSADSMTITHSITAS